MTNSSSVAQLMARYVTLPLSIGTHEGDVFEPLGSLHFLQSLCVALLVLTAAPEACSAALHAIIATLYAHCSCLSVLNNTAIGPPSACTLSHVVSISHQSLPVDSSDDSSDDLLLPLNDEKEPQGRMQHNNTIHTLQTVRLLGWYMSLCCLACNLVFPFHHRTVNFELSL